MTKEERPTLEEIVEKYSLTLWSTTYTDQGKSYQYMDYDGINVIINEWDKSFQLKWFVPKSILQLNALHVLLMTIPIILIEHINVFKMLLLFTNVG